MTKHALKRPAPRAQSQSRRARCPRQEQLASLGADLLAAELSPLRAWLLRLHLRRCAACRHEFERERLLWNDLSLLAASPAPPALRASILDGTRSRKYLQGEPGGAPMPHPMLKRRLAIALCVTVLLGAGTVLAGRLASTPDASFQSGGHRWQYKANFAGRITLRDAQGRVISIWLSERFDPKNLTALDLRVDGLRFTFPVLQDGTLKDGARKYTCPLFERGGLTLGSVEMEPLYADQVRALQKQADAEFRSLPYGSTGSNRWGARGFHKPLGVTWEMRNAQAEVLMKDRWGHLLSTERIRDPQLSPAQMGLPPGSIVPRMGAEPDFRIVVKGRASHARGFGVHRVRDADGKTLLLLEARPLKAAIR